MQQALDNIERVGTLEVPHDMQFQRRLWVFQRVGWAFMAVVVVLAVLGLFGHGLFSVGKVVSREGSFSVEYARIARHRAPATLRVAVSPSAVQGDEARVSFSRDTVDGMDIETVYPEPESVESGADGVVYVFKLSQEATSTEFVFNVMYEDVGRRKGSVTLDAHTPVKFTHVVLP